MTRLPLDGIRILEASEALALPYAMGIMADLGAEVIVVEHAGRLNIFRPPGPYPDNDPGENWWNRAGGWNYWSRSKMHLTLDLTNPKAREIFKALVRISDMVVENFTARVMRNFSLHYEELQKIKSDIIMLSNTGYGHSGPWRNYVGQAMVIESLLTAELTGYPNEGPNKAGQSPMDLITAWNMCTALLLALRHRKKTGKGQWIDHSMFQACTPLIVGPLMDTQMNHRYPPRMGNHHELMAPHNTYQCKGDEQWVTIAAASDEQFRSLCEVMGQPELAHDPRFAGVISRLENQEVLDQIISLWTEARDKYEAMKLLQGKGVPCGPVQSNKDVMLDPHVQSRGYFERVTHPPKAGVGTRLYPGRAFKLSETPLSIRKPAPTLGQDNAFVLGEMLGLSQGEIQELEEQHVIADYGWHKTRTDQGEEYLPIGLESPPAPLDTQIERGTVQSYDSDYKRILGLPD